MFDFERRHAQIARRSAANAEIIVQDERMSRLLRVLRPASCNLVRFAEERTAVVLQTGDLVAVWGAEEPDCNVRIYEVRAGGKLRERHILPTGRIGWWCLANLKDDVIATAMFLDGGVSTWRAYTGELVDCVDVGHRTVAIACTSYTHGDSETSTSSQITVASARGNIVFVDHQSDGDELRKCGTLKTECDETPILIAHGSILVSSTEDYIYVWDVSTTTRRVSARRKCIGRLPVPKARTERSVHLVDIDDNYLVAVGETQLRVYALTEHVPLLRIVKFEHFELSSIKLLGDNKAVVGINTDCSCALVCLETGQVLERMRIPRAIQRVYSLGITVDARLFVSSHEQPCGMAVLVAPRNSRLKPALEEYARRKYGKCFVHEYEASVRRRIDTSKKTVLLVTGLALILGVCRVLL